MNDPVVITPAMQLDTWDCGVASLSMFLGVSYADVRAKIRYRNPVGLSVYEMQSVARRLHMPLSRAKDVHADDVGILCLDRPSDPTNPEGEYEGHYALFLHGVLYNPAQGQLWVEAEDFTKQGRWRVVGILKRKD